MMSSSPSWKAAAPAAKPILPGDLDDAGGNDGTTDSTSSTSVVDDDISTTSSDEALCDILGLPSLAGMAMEVDDDDEEPIAASSGVQSTTTSPPTPMIPRRIDLPPVKGVSRKYHLPKDCFAYEIHNVLSPAECARLIEVAANSSPQPAGAAPHNINNKKKNTAETDNPPQQQPSARSSFRYITHAIHTAPDGRTKFEVELERPNPHKLAVFRHDEWVNTLWERLGPVILGKPPATKALEALRDSLGNFVRRESLNPVAGLNPRLRVLRYDASDRDEFQGHFDATTEIHALKQTSYVTVLLYLNDGGRKDFDGGETEFLPQGGQQQPGSLGAEIPSGASIETTSSSSSGNDNVRITPAAGSVVLFEHDLFHRGRPLLWGTKYVLRTDIMFENPSTDATPANEPSQGRESNERAPSLEGNSKPIPSTVEDVLSLLEGDPKDEGLSLLREALAEGLGFGANLESTSIDCLCSPGRFALNLMLREFLLPFGGTAGHQRTIDRFLDASFAALKEQPR